jgi:prepilin-type processing-associated H-X9-DG protein
MFDQAVETGKGIRANHQPGGSNVLYLDGHTAYVNYEHGPFDSQLGAWRDGPATPPVSPSIARCVGALGAAR